MSFTRRDILKIAGATAAASAVPSGLVASAAPASQTAAAGELFAVVSPGQAWGVFSGYHEAYHHAAMIRHSGAVCTSHVRCSPAFAEQLRNNTLKHFVEIDGWAVTSSEAETRGFDYLRRAADRARVRAQIHRHHVAMARSRIETHDAERADCAYYVVDRGMDGQPARLVGIADTVHLAEQACPPGAALHRCSLALAARIAASLGGDARPPAISAVTSLHTTTAEHRRRLANDPLFRLAFADESHRAPSPAGRYGFVAYDRQDRWIFGVGDNDENALSSAAWSAPYRPGRDLLTVKASPALLAQILSNGVEGPGFWRTVKGIAHHESELPPPRAARTTTRTAIRPPKPAWKR